MSRDNLFAILSCTVGIVFLGTLYVSFQIGYLIGYIFFASLFFVVDKLSDIEKINQNIYRELELQRNEKQSNKQKSKTIKK